MRIAKEGFQFTEEEDARIVDHPPGDAEDGELASVREGLEALSWEERQFLAWKAGRTFVSPALGAIKTLVEKGLLTPRDVMSCALTDAARRLLDRERELEDLRREIEALGGRVFVDFQRGATTANKIAVLRAIKKMMEGTTR